MSLRMNQTMLVHVPRTGGTWIREVVERLGLLRQQLRGDVDSHFTYPELSRYWSSLTPLIVVRHPWTWLESRWSHAAKIRARQNQRHYGPHQWFDDEVDETSFENTVSNFVDLPSGIVSETYWAMMGDGDWSQPGQVLRFETLSDSVVGALTRLERSKHFDEESFRSRCLAVVRSTPRVNSTRDEAREAGLFRCSDELRQRFLDSEIEYMGRFQYSRETL